MSRPIDGARPQPARKFSPAGLLQWVRRQHEQAEVVWSCYEAGPFGYGLHRPLEYGTLMPASRHQGPSTPARQTTTGKVGPPLAFAQDDGILKRTFAAASTCCPGHREKPPPPHGGGYANVAALAQDDGILKRTFIEASTAARASEKGHHRLTAAATRM